MMDTVLQDLRSACRMLRQSPGFALLTIATLALAIGADTALFSVVNGVLLNPLPYPQSDRLVTLYEKNAGLDKAPISYLNFLDWQRETRTFSSMAIYRHEDYTFTGRAQAERVNGFMISASFFSTLGIPPILGRDFQTDDDRLGAGPVVLLGGGFWKRRFGSSPDILGRSIELNGVAYTVVGIVPAGFSFYGVQRDVYTPIGQWTDPSFRDRRVDESAHAVGRLLPGVTLAQAQDDMNTIARDLAVNYPQADKDVGITLVSMKQDIVGSVQQFLIVLLAAVGFLLLIACANVAALLLARSMKRSHEFAIRAALGASRGRIIRQLLTESLLLSGLGGAFGLLLAFFGTRAVIGLFPAALPRAGDVELDARVLLFTLCVSLLAGIVFGLAPAFRGTRISLQHVLREAGRGASPSRHRLQGFFVAAEVALALVLLVGAGLTIRSLAALWRVNPGYTPSHAITFTMSIPSTPKTTSAETRARLRRFDDAMRSVPGVEAVSMTLGSRPMIHDSSLPFWILGQPKPANDNDMPQALFYLAEAGFQKAMGITLERGRFISPQDREGAPVVVDIDADFARTYFPHQNPIGRHIHLALFDQDAEIVGVVGHVRQWGPGNDPKSAIEAQFYYPYMQTPEKLMPLLADVSAVVLRTDGDPTAVMQPLRHAVAGVDPGAVIYDVETLHEVIAQTLAPRRLTMILLGLFASLALVLSCVGLYGVISYVVGERTREIGVRMALGARRGDVLRLVLSQGTKMAIAGVAIGTVLASFLTRLIRNQLFGVSAHDPLTYAAVAVLLLLVALAACYVPARRATRVDPMTALRCAANSGPFTARYTDQQELCMGRSPRVWLRIVLLCVLVALVWYRFMPRRAHQRLMPQKDVSVASPLNRPGGVPAPDDAYAIYSALYQQPSNEPLVFGENSQPDIPQVGSSCLKPATREEHELSESFNAANAQSHGWQPKFTIPQGYRILPPVQTSEALACIRMHGQGPASCSAWKGIEHVRFLGIPGVDQTGTHALVSIIKSCGPDCGSGGIFEVEKSGDTWKRSPPSSFTSDCSWMY